MGRRGNFKQGMMVGVALMALAQPPLAADTLTGNHAHIEFTGISRTRAEGILKVVEAARAGAVEMFRLPLPDPVLIKVALNPQKPLRLWTDGDKVIFWSAPDEDAFQPPAHPLYSLCQTVVRMGVYRQLKDFAGLSQGVLEGWIRYLAASNVHYVHQKLGDEGWTPAYDYDEAEGEGRLRQDTKDAARVRCDTVFRATNMLDDIAAKFGAEALGASIGRTFAQPIAGKEVVTTFAVALAQVTGRPETAQYIPADFFQPHPLWHTLDKDITPTHLAYGLRLERLDKGGVRLSYGDAEPEGVRILADSGHATFFRRPAGRWALTAVEVYASRYGEPPAPAETVTLYLCDAKMGVLHEFAVPAATFEKGQHRWYTLTLPDTDAPEVFYLCLNFRATAQRGVSVGFDSSVSLSHSRRALPAAHVADMEGKADWMIRCTLKPADEQTAQDLDGIVEGWNRDSIALREAALAEVVSPDKPPVVEPYPDTATGVVSQFFQDLLAGKKRALAYVAKGSFARVIEALKMWQRLNEAGDFRFLHALLAQETEENDYFSRMAKRVRHRPSDACVAAWYGFPADKPDALSLNTQAVRLVGENGRWKVAEWRTWYFTIAVPDNLRREEIEYALLKDVLRTGVTDYYALDKAYYAPLPHELAEVKSLAQAGLDSWVRGDFANLFNAVSLNSPPFSGGDASKLTVTLQEQRLKFQPSELVELQVKTEVDWAEAEKELRALLGARADEPLKHWRNARVVVLTCAVKGMMNAGGNNPTERTLSSVRIYVVKEDGQWRILNLPRVED